VHVGDHSAGVNARIPVSSRGLTLPVYLTIVAAQRGRVLVAIVATGVGIYAKPSRVQTLLEKMLDRLGAAT
jgi:hypothetical protein